MSVKNSPERQRSKRPVRLVAGDVSHRRAPEVVQKQLLERAGARDVTVGQNGGDVVVHELPAQAVHVAQHRCCRHHRVDSGVTVAHAAPAALLPDRRERATLHFPARFQSFERHMFTSAHWRGARSTLIGLQQKKVECQRKVLIYLLC